jgi:hypothetical protein
VSSINPVFQPMGPTIALVSGTPAQANPSPSSNTGDCFRIVNTSQNATPAAVATRISWGPTAAKAGVPTVAGPNNMYLAPNESIYLCLPADSWFNVAAGATTGSAEVTPGQGGAGG